MALMWGRTSGPMDSTEEPRPKRAESLACSEARFTGFPDHPRYKITGRYRRVGPFLNEVFVGHFDGLLAD